MVKNSWKGFEKWRMVHLQTDRGIQRNLEIKSKGIAITNRQVMYEILPKIYIDLIFFI